VWQSIAGVGQSINLINRCVCSNFETTYACHLSDRFPADFVPCLFLLQKATMTAPMEIEEVFSPVRKHVRGRGKAGV
jgi:hypothetical protein